MNETNWTLIIAMANADIPANKAIDKEAEDRAKDKGPEGFSGGADPWSSKQDILQDWDVEEKSRL